MATDQTPNSAGGRDEPGEGISAAPTGSTSGNNPEPEPDEPTDERPLPDAEARARLLAQSVAEEMHDRHEHERVFLEAVQKLLDSDSTGTVALRTEGTVIEVEIR